ncbi:hypothetical protein NKH77_26780 [Streptomyces sp. M19]
MADENTPNPPTDPEGEGVALRIEPVGLETEMQRSYLDYAMSVIVSRALPDVRTASSPCTAACCTPCTTAATGPRRASTSAPASSAT